MLWWGVECCAGEGSKERAGAPSVLSSKPDAGYLEALGYLLRMEWQAQGVRWFAGLAVPS